jgi:hypothetical protein
MAIDASELLGAPQIGGVGVTARGATMGRALNQGGVAAGGPIGAAGGGFSETG